jgi:phospholipid/cholesterol/gamma-HCH transport system substrate-binding protein
MKRNIIETVLGAVVLAVAGVFFVFSYSTANVGSVDGYEITANFSGIGGLAVGDDVEISGVKVGSVSKVELDPVTYLAKVTVNVQPDVKLPSDTAALISSKSLLGGRYLSLEPGGAEDYLAPGARIEYTQAPQNLEQLLGQFIFSMNDAKDKDKGEESAAAAAPAPAPVSVPAEAPALILELPTTGVQIPVPAQDIPEGQTDDSVPQ